MRHVRRTGGHRPTAGTSCELKKHKHAEAHDSLPAGNSTTDLPANNRQQPPSKSFKNQHIHINSFVDFIKLHLPCTIGHWHGKNPYVVSEKTIRNLEEQ